MSLAAPLDDLSLEGASSVPSSPGSRFKTAIMSSHNSEREAELAVAAPAHDERPNDVFHVAPAAEAAAAGSGVDDAGDVAGGNAHDGLDAASQDASDGVEAKQSSTAAHEDASSAAPQEQATHGDGDGPSEQNHGHDLSMPAQSREVNEHTVSTLHSVETVVDYADDETAGQATLQMVESQKVSAATSAGALKAQDETEERPMDEHEQHWAPAGVNIEEEEDFDAPPEPAPQPSDSSDDDDDGAVDV